MAASLYISTRLRNVRLSYQESHFNSLNLSVYSFPLLQMRLEALLCHVHRFDRIVVLNQIRIPYGASIL